MSCARQDHGASDSCAECLSEKLCAANLQIKTAEDRELEQLRRFMKDREERAALVLQIGEMRRDLDLRETHLAVVFDVAHAFICEEPDRCEPPCKWMAFCEDAAKKMAKQTLALKPKCNRCECGFSRPSSSEGFVCDPCLLAEAKVVSEKRKED